MASVISLTASVLMVIPTAGLCNLSVAGGGGEGALFIPGHPGTHSGNLACWNH